MSGKRNHSSSLEATDSIKKGLKVVSGMVDSNDANNL